MQRYVGFPKGELKVYLRSQLLHLSYGGVQLKKASRKLTFLSSVILLFIMIFTMTGCSERSAKSNEKTDVQSAFEQVVSKGYQGTEETFDAALAAMPYHNARHLPGGADPYRIGSMMMGRKQEVEA